MKIIKTTLIVMVLFLFPAVSWYYLTVGRDWRRDTLNELGVYGEIGAFHMEDLDGNVIGPEDLEGKNVLLNILNDQRSMEFMTRVYDQFDSREDFLFVTLLKGDIDRKDVRVKNAQWVFVDCGRELCETFIRETFLTEQQSAALVDKSGNIRQFYALNNESEFTRLVKHMAIMIPPKKRDKLELKRKTGI